MRISTLVAASISIAAGSIATAPMPAHGQQTTQGACVTYQNGYPESYACTVYRQPTWQTQCPRPTSRGVGRVFDSMDCGTRYFFDY